MGSSKCWDHDTTQLGNRSGNDPNDFPRNGLGSHKLFLDEMVEGYRDGRNPDNPEPSQNRSNSYKHGIANGRDDYARAPRTTAEMLRLMANKAIRDGIESLTGRRPPQSAVSASHAIGASVCPACGKTHFVNRSTRRLLGHERE
jgi:hypothetical protein